MAPSSRGVLIQYVRKRSLALLCNVAPRGNDTAISAICLCVAAEEDGSDVKGAAMDALAELAKPGCQIAISAVKKCLEDPNESNRDDAKEALNALGGNGPPSGAVMDTE